MAEPKSTAAEERAEAERAKTDRTAAADKAAAEKEKADKAAAERAAKGIPEAPVPSQEEADAINEGTYQATQHRDAKAGGEATTYKTR